MNIDLGAPVVDNTCLHDAALADTVPAAEQRFTGAMRAAGPVLSDLLFDVCCHLIGLEAAESARVPATCAGASPSSFQTSPITPMS
jgi:hypothetical protein